MSLRNNIRSISLCLTYPKEDSLPNLRGGPFPYRSFWDPFPNIWKPNYFKMLRGYIIFGALVFRNLALLIHLIGSKATNRKQEKSQGIEPRTFQSWVFCLAIFLAIWAITSRLDYHLVSKLHFEVCSHCIGHPKWIGRIPG